MRTTRIFLFLILSSVVVAPLHARKVTVFHPAKSPRAVRPPESLAADLRAPDENLRIKAARELLDGSTASDCFSEPPEIVELIPATLVAGHESRLLVMRDAGVCLSLFLIPLFKEGEHWYTAGAVEAATQLTEPEFRLDSLIRSGEQELILRNHAVDEGTGVLEVNLSIYKVLEGQLRVVFDQPEKQHISKPIRRGKKLGFFSDEETSKFVFEPNQSGDSTAAGLVSIHETRRLTVSFEGVETNSHERRRESTITVYRNWAWDDSTERFVAWLFTD